MSKCYKSGNVITHLEDGTKEEITTRELCENNPPSGAGGVWDSGGMDTVCDINLINRYKEAEEENMLAYQRIIEGEGTDADKENAENAVAAAMVNRNNAIKNCLNEITALENGQFGINEASEANSELQNIARLQKERALKEFQKLMATRDNKNRIIKINTDFSKRYDAYTEIFRLLFFLAIPLVLLAYLNKLGMINNLIYFRGALLIIILGVFMTFSKLMDIYSRSNIDFDKYNWNEKSVKEDSIKRARSAYSKRQGINIGGISLSKGTTHPSFYCDTDNASGDGATCWDPSQTRCVSGSARGSGSWPAKENKFCSVEGGGGGVTAPHYHWNASAGADGTGAAVPTGVGGVVGTSQLSGDELTTAQTAHSDSQALDDTTHIHPHS